MNEYNHIWTQGCGCRDWTNPFLHIVRAARYLMRRNRKRNRKRKKKKKKKEKRTNERTRALAREKESDNKKRESAKPYLESWKEAVRHAVEALELATHTLLARAAMCKSIVVLVNIHLPLLAFASGSVIAWGVMLRRVVVVETIEAAEFRAAAILGIMTIVLFVQVAGRLLILLILLPVYIFHRGKFMRIRVTLLQIRRALLTCWFWHWHVVLFFLIVVIVHWIVLTWCCSRLHSWALLQIHRDLLWIRKALLRIHRALSRIHRALFGCHRRHSEITYW